VTTFVSRLASLVRFELEPAKHRRRTFIQLAFVTNVVLVLPCAFISALLQLHIFDYSLTGPVATAPIHSLQGSHLVGSHPILFGLVRTCKNLFE